MSWRSRKSLTEHAALGGMLLLGALAFAAALAVESGFFVLPPAPQAVQPLPYAAPLPGAGTAMPGPIRIRHAQGWFVGIAQVTGPREVRLGTQTFALAHVSPVAGAESELRRLAEGRWVACMPLREGGHEADCGTADTDSLAHALIWARRARAKDGAPLGLRVAHIMRWGS